MHKTVQLFMHMRIPPIGNTLFLKDLAESTTLEDLFNSNYFEIALPMEYLPDSSNESIRGSADVTADYTPKYTRGVGSAREGYCKICDRWLKLKTSSYWYHMNYKHGISSKGVRCPEPIFRSDSQRLEGYCKECKKWIFLGNCRRNSRFPWLRHWQKVHTNKKQ